jgi:hypothetical protein
MHCTKALVVVLVLAAAPVSALAYTQQEAHACTPDAFRLCGDAIPDAGRVAQCLFHKRHELSPPCAMVFSGRHDARLQRAGAMSLER